MSARGGGRKDRNSNGRRRQLNRVYLRDRAVCWWCGTHVPRGQASRDHVTPLREGGSNDDSNIALAHQVCNVERDRQARADADAA